MNETLQMVLCLSVIAGPNCTSVTLIKDPDSRKIPGIQASPSANGAATVDTRVLPPPDHPLESGTVDPLREQSPTQPAAVKETTYRLGKIVAAEMSEIVCDRVLEDFSTTPIGDFPNGWRTRHKEHLSTAIRDKRYVVEQERDRRVLHARYQDFTITIFKQIKNWDLSEYPLLSWSWKAVELPTGADESSLKTNDSGASVYLIWKAGFLMKIKAIKYAWSSRLPLGTWVSRRFGNDQINVIESGLTYQNVWRKAVIDVRDDYRSRFGKKTHNPEAIAIMSDADATASHAEAYYADFCLCRLATPASR